MQNSKLFNFVFFFGPWVGDGELKEEDGFCQEVHRLAEWLHPDIGLEYLRANLVLISLSPWIRAIAGIDQVQSNKRYTDLQNSCIRRMAHKVIVCDDDH